MHTFDDRELATVLAALRYWQRCGLNQVDADPEHDVATSGGTLDPLSDDEIDALCERLNTTPAGKVKVWTVTNNRRGCPIETLVHTTEGAARADVIDGIESVGGRRTPDGERLSAASLPELCEAWENVAGGTCQIEEHEIEVALA